MPLKAVSHWTRKHNYVFVCMSFCLLVLFVVIDVLLPSRDAFLEVFNRFDEKGSGGLDQDELSALQVCHKKRTLCSMWAVFYFFAAHYAMHKDNFKLGSI